MEQHKGSTSPCCSCRAKSVQHSWNDRKDDEPLNHFSSHKGKTSKPSFRWLAAFIPSWMQSGRGKPVQEGRVWENCCTHPANWPNHQLAMLSAWCWLHWPKIRVWRATVKFWCNYIICDTSFFLFQCLAVTLVASPAGDLEASRVGLLVNQYVRLTSGEKETAFAS